MFRLFFLIPFLLFIGCNSTYKEPLNPSYSKGYVDGVVFFRNVLSNANIKVYDIDTNKLVKELSSDENGGFHFSIPYNSHVYKIIARKNSIKLVSYTKLLKDEHIFLSVTPFSTLVDILYDRFGLYRSDEIIGYLFGIEPLHTSVLVDDFYKNIIYRLDLVSSKKGYSFSEGFEILKDDLRDDIFGDDNSEFISSLLNELKSVGIYSKLINQNQYEINLNDITRDIVSSKYDYYNYLKSVIRKYFNNTFEYYNNKIELYRRDLEKAFYSYNKRLFFIGNITYLKEKNITVSTIEFNDKNYTFKVNDKNYSISDNDDIIYEGNLSAEGNNLDLNGSFNVSLYYDLNGNDLNISIDKLSFPKFNVTYTSTLFRFKNDKVKYIFTPTVNLNYRDNKNSFNGKIYITYLMHDGYNYLFHRSKFINNGYFPEKIEFKGDMSVDILEKPVKNSDIFFVLDTPIPSNRDILSYGKIEYKGYLNNFYIDDNKFNLFVYDNNTIFTILILENQFYLSSIDYIIRSPINIGVDFEKAKKFFDYEKLN